MRTRRFAALLLSSLAPVVLAETVPPGAFEEHLEKGLRHLEKSRYPQAIEELEKARSLTDRSCRRCVRGIALAQFRLHRYEDALLSYEELFELAPGESIKILRRLVRLYDRLDRSQNAVQAYKTFLESSEHTEEIIAAYNELGCRLLRPPSDGSPHRGDAERAFRNALDLSDGKANTLRQNLAEALWQLNRKDEALTVIRGVVPPEEESWEDLELTVLSASLRQELAKVRSTWTPRQRALAQGGALYVEGDVRAPEKLYSPQPQYSELARKRRIQGVVISQVVIDEEGNVTQAKVLKGLHPDLDEQAIKAIRKWKFKPATLNGEPVAVYYNLTTNFRLQ